MLTHAIDIYHQYLTQNFLITLGYKNKEQYIQIIFRHTEFRHIIGLHYLKDLQQLKSDSKVIYQKIKSQDITLEQLQKSSFFDKNVRTRLDAFVKIFQSLMDDISNHHRTKFYRCHDQTVHPNSKIVADYMVVYQDNHQTYYLFIQKDQYKNNVFFPISFFKKGNLDFEINNPFISLMTVLNVVKFKADFLYCHQRYSRKELLTIELIIDCLP